MITFGRGGVEFLIKDMRRRFPERTAGEIHWTMEAVLERMAPSRNRTILQRNMIHALEAWRETGNQPTPENLVIRTLGPRRGCPEVP